MVYLLISKQLQKAPLLFVAKSVVSEFPIKLVQWNRKSQVNIILVQVWSKFNVGPFSHSFICSSQGESMFRARRHGTEKSPVTSPGDFTGEITRLQHFSWWVFSHHVSNYLIQSRCEAMGQTISSSCFLGPQTFLKHQMVVFHLSLSFVLLMFNPYGVTLHIYVYCIPKP
jgi:hypothetical protein